MTEPIRSKTGLADFYDDPKVVETYIKGRTGQPLNSVLHERQVTFLNDVIGELAPRRLLEIAPGPARLSTEIRPVPTAVGMDFSPNMLATAQRRTRERGQSWWNFARGDGFKLPFATGAFDFAFSIRFVRRFEPRPRQDLYREIRRVLKPGGHVVLDAQNKLVAGPHREGRNTYQVYDELWLRDELIAELTANGLVPVRIEGMMRQFNLQWQIHRLRRFGLGVPAKLLIRALEWTPDTNPSTWMVLCRSSGPAT